MLVVLCLCAYVDAYVAHFTAFLNVFCIFKFVLVASEGPSLLMAHVVGIFMALNVEK